MRDILDRLDRGVIVEATLAAGEIPPHKISKVINPKTNKFFTRGELFVYKVQTSSPFTLVTGGEVTIAPSQARKAKAWISTGPIGTEKFETIDGEEISNTQLQKTVEFGSKEAETLKVKGSDIFGTTDVNITDFGNNMETILNAGGFPASEMYNKIANNQILKKQGKLGAAVIELAKQANSGQIPVFPKDLTTAEIKAIELYASEYLGVLGLISGGASFKKGNRKDFEEFIGVNLSDMIMYFPKNVSNPLADSFSIVNNKSGHAIKISSKAAGKGAPPSLGSMKIPDDLKKKYKAAAEFLNKAQDSSSSALSQPFDLMNYLYKIAPDKIPSSYHSLLPFTPEVINQVETSIKKRTPIPRKIMGRFEKRLSVRALKSNATDGGKAWWATIQDVMRAVNYGDAIADFRPALIESLGYNFIQLYTNVIKDKLVTEVFWPAKISGQVKLKTKGSTIEPSKGKMSVEISPGPGDELEVPSGDSGAVDSTDAGDSPNDAAGGELDYEPGRSDIKASDTVVEPKTRTPSKASELEKFGRTRQRR